MTKITATELKIKGVSVVESALREDGAAVITVRGRGKNVVLDFATWNKLREFELDIAIQEARKDVAEGNYVVESVDEHMKRFQLPNHVGAGDSG